MSLPFNIEYKGIVQQYELEIGASRGSVAGNTSLLKEFTAASNLAIDDYVALMIQVSGSWKADDTNHTDYPEILTDLVSGQRDYTFLTDENGNMILDIYKVYLLTGGAYKLLDYANADTETSASSFTNGLNATGVASKYDKTANAIRLDLTPTANVTKGLKVSINREANYFLFTDTDKKPGFPGTHHKYFYLKPALDYARRNGLASFDRIQGAVMQTEQEIKEYFNRRAKDERNALNINRESTR